MKCLIKWDWCDLYSEVLLLTAGDNIVCNGGRERGRKAGRNTGREREREREKILDPSLENRKQLWGNVQDTCPHVSYNIRWDIPYLYLLLVLPVFLFAEWPLYLRRSISLCGRMLRPPLCSAACGFQLHNTLHLQLCPGQGSVASNCPVLKYLPFHPGETSYVSFLFLLERRLNNTCLMSLALTHSRDFQLLTSLEDDLWAPDPHLCAELTSPLPRPTWTLKSLDVLGWHLPLLLTGCVILHRLLILILPWLSLL